MAETSKEKLNIKLRVYDKFIDVAINRDEEHLYRAAAKLISERYGIYAQFYANRKTDHEVALMTLVDIALRYEQEHQRNDTAPYEDILSQLTSEIQTALE